MVCPRHLKSYVMLCCKWPSILTISEVFSTTEHLATNRCVKMDSTSLPDKSPGKLVYSTRSRVFNSLVRLRHEPNTGACRIPPPIQCDGGGGSKRGDGESPNFAPAYALCGAALRNSGLDGLLEMLRQPFDESRVLDELLLGNCLPGDDDDDDFPESSLATFVLLPPRWFRFSLSWPLDSDSTDSEICDTADAVTTRMRFPLSLPIVGQKLASKDRKIVGTKVFLIIRPQPPRFQRSRS